MKNSMPMESKTSSSSSSEDSGYADYPVYHITESQMREYEAMAKQLQSQEIGRLMSAIGRGLKKLFWPSANSSDAILDPTAGRNRTAL